MKTINDQYHDGSANESPVHTQNLDSMDEIQNESPVVTGGKGIDIESLSEQNYGRLSHQFTWFLFVILSINTCVAAVISGIHFKNEYVSLMQSRVETVGNNLKTFMEEILGLGLPIGSLEGIEKELEKTVSGDLKAIYANVVDENSRVIYSYPERKTIDAFYPDHLLPLLKGNIEKTFATASAYNTFIPIQDPTNNSIVGGINIGIPKKFVYSKTVDSLSTLIATFIVFIIVTLVLLYLMTKRTIKPLEALTHGAFALAKGNLTVRADVTEKNEIGFLAESFNYMAERLEQDRHKLTAYNVELEKRNNKLQRAHEHILQRENKLKSAQSQLVLSEKMASLGVLISGIAHEINTPAGAIANVASDLRGRVQAITGDLMNIHDLSEDELKLLGSFSEEFRPNENIAEGGSQWKKSREIKNWLRESGIDNEKMIVNTLSKYNLLDRDKLEQYKCLFKKKWAMNLMDSLGTVNVGMRICESSIKKISEIVKALKYYAYTDMDKTSLVDINENIDNVLLLLHNKLKYAIDVKKDPGTLTQIHCTSEINQVWTNLISNAHDAIIETVPKDEKGIIMIKTREENGSIIVRITDNGSGISEENINKMFDPFFTTKGLGKGTGLGLSIVSGIVKKHKGEIAVESIPGQTTFTVSLPLDKENGGRNNGE